MSIENGITPGASKAASLVAGHGASRPQPGSGAPGGFAHLLLNLGAEELPADMLWGEAAALPGEETLPVADLGAASAAEAVDPALLALVPAPATGPAAPIVVLPPTASAQAELAVAAPGPTAAAAVPAGGVTSAGTGRAAEPAIEAAAMDAPPAAPVAPRARALEAPAWRAAPAAVPENELPAQPAADAAGAPTVPEVQPLLRQASLVQRLAQQRGATAPGAVAASAPRGEDIMARLGWQMADAAQGAGPAVPALAAWSDAVLQRTGERRGDKGGRVGEPGAFGAVASAEGVRMGQDVLAVAPDGGLTTEMRVAEQVSYWVGRGAQTAELEVEGIDERPIHVSIDLQGQEARIEFRAEQAQTRQVLQDAMPHLRELLEREGLTLAGLSVGHSDARGGQEQSAERGRSGPRTARVEAAAEGPAAAAGPRAALPPGRSLDLYV